MSRRRSTLLAIQGNQTLRDWLSYKKLESCKHILQNAGFGDLADIAAVDSAGLEKIISAIPLDERKTGMRVLIKSLQKVGLESYMNGSGLQEFDDLVEADYGAEAPDVKTSPKPEPKVAAKRVSSVTSAGQGAGASGAATASKTDSTSSKSDVAAKATPPAKAEPAALAPVAESPAKKVAPASVSARPEPLKLAPLVEVDGDSEPVTTKHLGLDKSPEPQSARSNSSASSSNSPRSSTSGSVTDKARSASAAKSALGAGAASSPPPRRPGSAAEVSSPTDDPPPPPPDDGDDAPLPPKAVAPTAAAAAASASAAKPDKPEPRSADSGQAAAAPALPAAAAAAAAATAPASSSPASSSSASGAPSSRTSTSAPPPHTRTPSLSAPLSDTINSSARRENWGSGGLLTPGSGASAMSDRSPFSPAGSSLTSSSSYQNTPQMAPAAAPAGMVIPPASPAVGPAASPALGPQAVSAHSTPVSVESYLCMRYQAAAPGAASASPPDASAPWVDRFFLLKGSELRWLTSLRDGITERSVPLPHVLRALDRVDERTLRLDLGDQGMLELWSAIAPLIEQWGERLGVFVRKPSTARPRPSLRIQVPPKGDAASSAPPTPPPSLAGVPVPERKDGEAKSGGNSGSSKSKEDGKDIKDAAAAAGKEGGKEVKSPPGTDSEPVSPMPADSAHSRGPSAAAAGGGAPSLASGLADAADAVGREHVQTMISGCNFTLYEFAVPTAPTSSAAAAGGGGGGHARKGSMFNPLEPVKPKVTRREIFLFYAVDDTLFGSVYWCEPGQRVQSAARRLRFHLLSDIYVGKQTPVFSTSEADAALEERCFSLISTEEGKSLDLEADSEDLVESWLAGLKHVLVHSGKGVVVNSEDGPEAGAASAGGALSGAASPVSPVSRSPAASAAPPAKAASPAKGAGGSAGVSAGVALAKPKAADGKAGEDRKGDEKRSAGTAAGAKMPAVAPPDTSASAERVAILRKMLVQGSTFKKYKRGRATQRLIWCTPLLDHVLWGEGDKKTVKGFLMAKDITKVVRSSPDGGKTFRLSLISPERTLELETKTQAMLDDWVEAFEYLVKYALKVRREREAAADKAVEKAYAQVLRTGEIFKKWPANRNFKKGAETVRKLITDHQLQSLYWGDHVTNYVKGSLSMSEIIEIEEVPNNELQFTIYSKGRYLDLEAKTADVRTAWVNALRWYVSTK